MPFNPHREAHLLQERIQRAHTLTPVLAAEVDGARLPVLAGPASNREGKDRSPD
jgi:hypothetical protein